MKKSFLVIGLGRYGANIVKVLAMNTCDCLAIDIKEESVKQVSKYNQNCLIADGTKYEVLKELDANKFSHVIVAIGNNLQASILTVLNLKKLGCPLITRLINSPFLRFLISVCFIVFAPFKLCQHQSHIIII